MRVNFKTISTILIIIFTVLLIGILISYYNAPIELNNDYTKNNAVTNHEIEKVISENVSGEVVSSVLPSESGDESGDKETQIITSTTIVKEDEKKEQVIISSEDTMTNKEKRDILTELDNTLMDLLEVVDKVQTVDETRLVTDEGEVQE